MSDLRWGMIGCGAVTERKSGPAFYKTQGSCLAGLWNRSHERALDYASRHPVETVFETLEAMLASPEIDAVYIATPPASHLELALKVAAAGKPCCVEKPIANSTTEARRMIDAFDHAGLPLFVSYYRRSLPRFRQIKDWVDAGHLGRLDTLDWTLTRTARPAGDRLPWRLDLDEAPGGLFDDLACHGLDLFDHLFGEISGVFGRKLERDVEGGIPVRIQANWTHASGLRGVGVWDFAAEQRVDTVIVSGENGTIRFSVFEDEPIRINSRTLCDTRVIANPDPIQGPHVANLVEALVQGGRHPSTAVSAARTMLARDLILADSAL